MRNEINAEFGCIAARIGRIISRDPVLLAALSLATISIFLVPPSGEYFAYIDYKVLCCLFCLMSIVAGIRKIGVFDRLALVLTRRVTSLRALTAVLVFSTFFASMAVTNDVALITFVPFALVLLKNVERPIARMRVVTLQTIAANAGSSLTPIGNPQNLFIFSYYGLDAEFFFRSIAPVALVGGVFLAIAVIAFVPRVPIDHRSGAHNYKPDYPRIVSYVVFFALSVLAVFRVIDYRPVTVAVFAYLCLFDRDLLARGADYSLLITFIGFFLFIGNIQRIDSVKTFLTDFVAKDVTLVSALASQIISNVPAAMLLSGFTKNAAGLLRGVSVGGMGTLIASMASVISFKFFARNRKGESLAYLRVFTAWNVLFFIILYGICIALY